MSELPAPGTVRPITRWGEQVMHRTLQPVTAFDDELATLVADMVATMYAAEGVGLAAQQIGVDRALFVFDCPDDDHVRHSGVVCNPRLTLPSGDDRKLDDADEGCLSFPGAFVSCPRPDWARVDGVDQDGGPVSYEGKGLFARCLQHEIDHLHGRLFIDHMGAFKRRSALGKWAKIKGKYPDFIRRLPDDDVEHADEEL